jgi:predicted AlkP superfamily pyrophosphatase or phosphodiesterase
MSAMDHAVLIVVDGLRPDAISFPETPHICRLMAEGAACLRARTVPPAMTLPAHFSIFTGVPPSDHGVWANTNDPAPAPEYPGLMERVQFHRGRSAAFFSWEPLRNLWPPGAVEMAHCRNTVSEADHDLRLAEACGRWVGKRRPNFVFLYLERTDFAGHAEGWMSDFYREAVRGADAAVGRFLALLESAGCRKQYGIVLQSDHGGIGRDHGNRTEPEVLTIPWMAAGRGIPAGQSISAPVSVLDTAPALARMIGLPPAENGPVRPPLPIWGGAPTAGEKAGI